MTYGKSGDLEIKTEIKSETSESSNDEKKASSLILPVDEEFKCKYCDTIFSQKSHLKVHIESVRKGKKPLKCDICSATFSYKGHLKSHKNFVK